MVINGNLSLNGCQNLEILRNLKEVKKDLACSDEIKDLGDLEYMGGDLDLRGCENLKSFGKLIFVFKNLLLYNCNKLKSLGNLKKIKGSLYFPVNLEDLGDLENCISLENLGDLKYVGEDLDLTKCKNIKSLRNLEEIKGIIYLNGSGITKEYIKENYPHLFVKCKW